MEGSFIMTKYIYKGRHHIDDELVDEAIQMQADVNNRDLCSEELQEVWENEVEAIEEKN